MANRRMFSKEIIGSDLFLDLPVSCRELYFQLGMYADDDGFVSPKKVIRMIGASEDDIKVLGAKGFVIPFESGVIVIRHWRENNYIRKDTYQPTIYKKELKLALEDEIYPRIQSVDEPSTGLSHSIGKYNKYNKGKPFFNNCPMIQKYGKWYVIEKGGEILFTGSEEKIKYK